MLLLLSEDRTIPIKKGDKLIPQKGGFANIERKRKQAGLLPQTVRRIGVQIIDSEEFKQQLLKEIFEDNKAVTFLGVMAKYNPATAYEGGTGGINIQINTLVDREVGDKEPVKINITPPDSDED